MDLSFGIRIRSIATDVASSISAAELDHLKLELHIQFAILGRYEWHRSSSAERYIKRLFDNAIIALMNFRSAVINGRQVNTHHYLVHAVIWACRHMNLDASTPLNRREHIIMSPYQFLSGRQQHEFPWDLIPLGAPAYCNLPDKHKRASAEDETKTTKCYYLFPAGNLPLPINYDGAYAASHREHVFLTMSHQYVTAASFDILGSRPEQHRFLVTKALTRLLHPNPYRHDLTAPLHDPASPTAPDDSTSPSDDPSTELPPGDPSTEPPPGDVPIPETLGDEEAPSART
mmetsp:Transcript_18283/g.59015  ORF Transcript_18283/g.59015 Transcript_18283/m.59015 type:complete len:288 (+) Transcript_18283:163-1026(+)